MIRRTPLRGMRSTSAVAAGSAGPVAVRAAMAASTSSLVMRPPGPVPVTVCRSTPCWLASRRSAGAARTLPPETPPETPPEAPPPPEAGAAGAVVAGGGVALAPGVACAADSAAADDASARSGVSPGAPIQPRTVPTGTSSSSATINCRTTPPAAASISTTDFSVSTSRMASPCATASPACFSQVTTRPTSMPLLKRNIRIGVAIDDFLLA